MKLADMVPGFIYLAEQRKAFKDVSGEVYSTLGSDANEAEGQLLQANAILLEANMDILLSIPKQAQTYLLPVGGEILLADNVTRTVDVGEILIYDHGLDRENLLVRNPYCDHPTSFLQFSCLAHDGLAFGYVVQQLNMAVARNCLSPIAGTCPTIAIHLGVFDARAETAFVLGLQKTRFFAYVIEGSFEIEGRLLHNGDSLLLWNLKTAEMEALSPNSIVFVINC